MIADAPALALITPAECRAYLARRLASRDWWVLPWLSERAAVVSIELERRHYTNTSSADFEIVTLPLAEVFAVSLAHKRRCSPRRLAMLLDKMGNTDRRATLARDFATRDVLVLGEPKVTVPRLKAFERWLTADPLARYWRERRN